MVFIMVFISLVCKYTENHFTYLANKRDSDSDSDY